MGAMEAPPTAPPLRDVAGRFPVPPCGDDIQHPEAIGVWQSLDGDRVFVYDGCSVRFENSLSVPPEMALFTGWRNVARAFTVDVRDYADPFPYFRTRATWSGDSLWSSSILAEREVCRWDGERFTLGDGSSPFVRARNTADLGIVARDLLFADRFLPTEEELAAERGVPMPPEGLPPLDYIQSMMCPTGACAGTPEGEGTP